jgi:biopolymer transport protein ExbB/TolQ
MGSETILAVIACCAMLAAVLMMVFAYRLNEKWTERNEQWADICEEQNRLMEQMNDEWFKFYEGVLKNGRD